METFKQEDEIVYIPSSNPSSPAVTSQECLDLQQAHVSVSSDAGVDDSEDEETMEIQAAFSKATSQVLGTVSWFTRIVSYQRLVFALINSTQVIVLFYCTAGLWPEMSLGSVFWDLSVVCSACDLRDVDSPDLVPFGKICFDWKYIMYCLLQCIKTVCKGYVSMNVQTNMMDLYLFKIKI